jgi:hypothetical protein
MALPCGGAILVGGKVEMAAVGAGMGLLISDIPHGAYELIVEDYGILANNPNFTNTGFNPYDLNKKYKPPSDAMNEYWHDFIRGAHADRFYQFINDQCDF